MDCALGDCGVTFRTHQVFRQGHRAGVIFLRLINEALIVVVGINRRPGMSTSPDIVAMFGELGDISGRTLTSPFAIKTRPVSN
jgi:hypothetical protein